MRHKIIPFLLLITALSYSIMPYSHDGEVHTISGNSKADSLDACVEPTVIMQKKHHIFLLQHRDETVENGIRTKKHSFANCIDCHVNYDDNGKAIPINSEGQFCQECHVKTATNITCFSCHASEPRFPKHQKMSKSDIHNIRELANRVVNND